MGNGCACLGTQDRLAASPQHTSPPNNITVAIVPCPTSEMLVTLTKFYKQRTHPAALGLQGDESAVLGAPQREDHLQAARAVPGSQPLEPEAAARQHLRPYVRPRQRRTHHLPAQ